MLAQPFHGRDQVRRRVIPQLAQRLRPSRAPLIEDDDAIVGGIEEAAVCGGRSGARSAVEEDRRHPIRVAGNLPVHDMDVVELGHAGLKGSIPGKSSLRMTREAAVEEQRISVCRA